MHLLTDNNPKIAKGEALGWHTFVLHLAPANLSGHEVCAGRTPGCTLGCLNMAGRGGIIRKGETTNTIQRARIRRTKLFFEYRARFMALLVADIEAGLRIAHREGRKLAIRPNGTSDLAWEKYPCIRNGIEYTNVFAAFPEVQFYDYTKILGRKVSGIRNYRLTFSVSERTNRREMLTAMDRGMNLAVVFAGHLPAEFEGWSVINGDETDLRFRDPVGVVVGLKAKGKAKRDTTGFVRQPIMLKLAA